MDRLRVVELDISDSFAPPTSGISDDADISNFAAIRLKKEVPDVSLLGLQSEMQDLKHRQPGIILVQKTKSQYQNGKLKSSESDFLIVVIL